MTGASDVSALDLRLLRAVRRWLGGTPAERAAVTLSHVGEHAVGWTALAAAGALAQPSRRREWSAAAALVLAAHASSVVLKRVVRRPRPHLDDCPPLVATPSRLSFPSSHAASTTAAALLLAPLAGGGAATLVAAALVPAMSVSRVLLGVHYPSDVVAGCAIGAAVGVVGHRVLGAPVRLGGAVRVVPTPVRHHAVTAGPA